MRLSRELLAVLLLLTWPIDVAPKKLKSRCPFGFELAYDDDKKPVCYRLSDAPLNFTDKFKDCTDNIFTVHLYHRLNITKTKKVIWTDIKSPYPGGLLVDWSYAGSIRDPSNYTYDAKYDSALGLDEEFCVVVDPVSNFTAVRCDGGEKHYWYCFVEPYQDKRSKEGCKGSGDYWRFYTPVSTCLSTLKGTGGTLLRATWSQAKRLCIDDTRNGTLLNTGWRLSNHPLLSSAESSPTFPLGMTMVEEGILERMTLNKTDRYEIPDSEWHFESSVRWSSNTPYVALANGLWKLVDATYTFFYVLCERPVTLEHARMTIFEAGRGSDRSLMLKVESVEKKYIRCFTDSDSFIPRGAGTKWVDGDDDDDDDDGTKWSEDEDRYRVDVIADGYYWCIHRDYRNYYASETNKILFVKRPEETQNRYACLIRVNSYEMKYLNSRKNSWKKKLKQFIYYRTRYIEEFGDSENITEAMVSLFKKERGLEKEDPEVIKDLKIKRVFLDWRTVLLHVELEPGMKPLQPLTTLSATSKEHMMEVLYMRPVYICKGFKSVPDLKLGQMTTLGCSRFTCVGNYNEGVQWVETEVDGCESSTTEYTRRRMVTAEMELRPAMPTAEPLPKSSIGKSDPFPDHNKSDSGESTEYGNYTEWTTVSTVSLQENVTEIDWSTITTVNTSIDWGTVTTVNTPTTEPPVEATTESKPEVTTEMTEPTPTTTARPPQEQFEEVLSGLQQLLENGTVHLDSLEEPFSQVDNLLSIEDENFNISSSLLHLLDQLANRVDLGVERQAVKIRENVAMMMADASPASPIRGVRVAAGVGRNDAFTNRTFDFINDQSNIAELLTNDQSEAVVYLPESVTRDYRRISFVAYRNQRAFQSDLTVNSRVFSVNVENLTRFDRGEVIDIHLTPLVETPERNRSRVCAYWQFDDAGSGRWARDGCRLIRATRAGAMDTCRCDHLTHFAEVLVPRTVFSEGDERALEVLSVVGCCVSLAGLLLVGLTAALFRSWRRDYSNKIWLQLCAAIFLVGVCFLVAVYADFDRYDVPCMLVGVVLHYSVVASFCWMLVAAVLSYRRLVLVFTRDASHKLLRAAAFAWGAPCAVVGVLLAVEPRAYAGRFDELEAVRSFCYPTGLGLWLAVYAPIALVLLANWTLFVLIVRSVFASRRIQRHGDSNEALRCASVSCLLVFLFGLPWVIGLFASNLAMAYIFCLSANYQGFVLFVFFVVGNKKTRDLWLNKLKIKQTRKVPVTSSTYTNRSVGPGWRPGAEGTSSIEAKTSKPRSLTSPDDSRFS